jgi:formamidopyrimidine-DNA glycosylase
VPELPEVETIRRDLRAAVCGQRITAVTVSGLRSVRRHPDRRVFASGLEGQTLLEVSRKGKYLVCRLDGGQALVIHLGMSGQLLLSEGATSPPPHAHVRLGLSGGGELRFVDPRTFGQLFLSVPCSSGTVPELTHLGPDALEDRLDEERLALALSTRQTRLKALLVDQRFLAGIGNIYSDEILFAAGLRWDRRAGSLSRQEARVLHRAMQATLAAAIQARGSSLADAQYRDLYGVPGRYQLQHQVYGREGLPCPRCRAPVVRERWAGRSSFWCRACQS